MGKLDSTQLSRRSFLIGAGAGALTLSLGLSHLQPRGNIALAAAPATPATGPTPYRDWTDVYRERWTWDRVAKGTHTRANCISACSWDLFLKDGIVWREEQ